MAQEGVTKFQLDYTAGPPLPAAELTGLRAWRKLLNLAGLIGQDPARYEGVGFGNISQRGRGTRFVITGSQTGHLSELDETHFATVLECYPERNAVVATGPLRPSSESMTHGTLYALADGIQWVLHGHSPVLWRQAAALDIPITAAEVEYGTPAMAREVARLFAETDVSSRRIFAMGGHEDGVVAFGASAGEAGTVLLRYLAQALEVEYNK